MCGHKVTDFVKFDTHLVQKISLSNNQEYDNLIDKEIKTTTPFCSHEVGNILPNLPGKLVIAKQSWVNKLEI